MRIAAWLQGLLRTRQSGLRKPPPRRYHDELFPNLFVRQLEDRRVLNGTALSWDHGAEEATIDAGALANDGLPDTFHVVRQGDEVQISVNGREVYAAPLANLENITLNGSRDSDTLIVDFSGGDPFPAGGLIFNGMDGGQDSVLAQGGSSGGLIDTVTHRFDRVGDGFLHVAWAGDDAGSAAGLVYRGVESIVDTTAPDQLVFQFASAAETVTISDDGNPGDGLSTISSTGGTVVTFAGPRDSFVVETDVPGGGSDTVNVDGLDADLVADLTIRGDADDTLNFAGEIDLGGRSLVATGGTIQVDGAIASQGGTVELDAGSEGSLLVSGTIDVSDAASGQIGGTVHLLGDQVGLLAGAHVDASGDAGGGTILIGGDYQGANPDVGNATLTVIAPEATIRADALTHGDGGRVIVWADDGTYFYGRLTARGGAESGDGGFAEISGKINLVQHGDVDLRAPRGATGTLLLDPLDVRIVGGMADGHDDPDPSATALIHAIGSNTAGTIALADEGTGTPPPNPFLVYESEIEAQSATANIILEARNSITVTGAFTNGDVLIQNSLILRTRNDTGDGIGGIDLTAGGALSNLVFMTTGSGSITIETGSDGAGGGGSAPGEAPITLGKLATAGGDVLVTAEGTLNVNGDVVAGGGGEIRLVTTGGGDIHVRANVVDAGGDNLVVLDSSDAITQQTGTLIVAQSLRLTADNAIGSATSSSANPIMISVENVSAALDGATATGRIVIAEADDANVTTVDGQSGVTATNNRDIGIGSYSGTITVLDPITTGGTGRIAVGADGTTNNVVLKANVQTDAGAIAIGARGNILTDGTGTIIATVDGFGWLRMDAGNGIGTSTNPILIDVAVVAAQIVNPASTGGIHITQVDGYQGDLTVGSLLGADGINAPNGDVRLTTEAGTITVAQPVVALGLALRANGASSDIITVAGTGDVVSDVGLWLEAGRSITLSDRVECGGGDIIVTTGTANTGVLTLTGGGSLTADVEIRITTDDLDVQSGASITCDGPMHIRPSSSPRDIDLGSDTPGRLGITDAEFDRITTNVLEIGASPADIILSANVDPQNIRALILEIGGRIVTTAQSNTIAVDTLSLSGESVGAPGARISTKVAKLGVYAGFGGVYLAELEDGLTVTQAGSTNGIYSDGNIDLTVVGDLTVDRSIRAGGNAYIKLVTTAGGNIRVEANITDGGSDNLAVLDADDAITQTAGTLITAESLRLTANNAIGSATSSSADPILTRVENLSAALDGATASGRIVVADVDDFNVTTVDGQSGVTATNGRDIGIGSYSGTITVLDPITTGGAGRIAIGADDTTTNVVLQANVQTDAGAIAIGARGSILTDGTGTIIATVAGAGALRMDAGNGIGTAANPIQIDVAVVAAQLVNPAATGGIYVTQVDGYQGDLVIGPVLFVGGIVTTNNNDVSVETEAGTLTVAAPVTAHGSGNVNLVANGASSDLVTSPGTGGVLSGSGQIALTAGRAITLSDQVATGGGVTLTTGTGNMGLLTLVDGGAMSGSITGGGPIVINADDLAINNPAATAINGGTGRVTIRPADQTDAARGIDLGSDTPGRLGITVDELNRISTTGVVQIGDTFAGDVILSASIDPQNFSTLRINSSGSLTTTAEANTITVQSLAIDVHDEIGATLVAISTSVTNLAARSKVAGDAFLADGADGVTVAAVDGLSGITVTAGDLHLTAAGGPITDSPDATIAVSGAATLTAGTDITLGDGPANSTNFGSLSLTGAIVTVTEDSSTLLTGVNVQSLTLTSAGAIEDATNINVTGAAVMNAGTNPIILGDQPGDTTNFGSLELIGGNVTIQEDSETRLVGADVGTLDITSAGDIIIGRRIDGSSSDKAVKAAGPVVLHAAGNLHVPDNPALAPGESELAGGSITADAGGTIVIDDGAVLQSATGKVTNAPPILRIGEKDPDKVLVPGDPLQELVGSAGGMPPGENLELGENFTITVTWDDGVQNVVAGVNSSQQLSMQVAEDGTAAVNVVDDGTNYIELDVSREYSVEYLSTVTENDLFATVEVQNDPNIRLSDSSGVDLNRVSAVVATSFAGQQFTAPAAMESREPEPITAREAPPAPLPELRSVPPQPSSRSEEIRVKPEEIVEDERKIYIVKVGPDGSEGEKQSLPDDALSNLSALMEKLKGSAEEGKEGLPSGLYRIYLEEVGFPRRKVMEFYKSGDTLGEQVRPPGRGSMPILDQGSETPGLEKGVRTLFSAGDSPLQASVGEKRVLTPFSNPGGGAAVLTAGSLAAYPALGRWQQSIDRAMADTDEKSFGKAARLRRRFLR